MAFHPLFPDYNNEQYLPRYGCRGDLRLETVFTGLEDCFKKLETCVQQVKTKTAVVFNQNKKQKQRLRFPNPGLTSGYILFFTSTFL